MEPQVEPARSRLLEVDVTRILATMFMVQGHTLDVLLAPQFRAGAAYNFWLFLRGLTAPTFLFLAGLSFTLSSTKHWDSYLAPSSSFYRRIRKFGFFVLLGYAMHLPVSSFGDLAGLNAAGWQSWLQVDVLQCIGVTLICLQLLVMACRTPQRFAKVALGLSIFVVLATPLVAGVEWQAGLPLPVASYLGLQTGSLFPLFPWSGYILLGAATGYGARQWKSDMARMRRVLPVIGAAFILVGLCRIPHYLYPQVDFWLTSPSLFLIRVGCVGLLLTAVSYVTQRIKFPERPTQYLAQESLTIYFVHVCILYGSVWNLGLRQTIGATLSPGPTLLSIAALVSSMALLGFTWHWLKRNEPRTSGWIRSAAAVLAIAYCVG
jgi:uncharacterized membrane protein